MIKKKQKRNVYLDLKNNDEIKQKYLFKKSWEGDKRTNNNLLETI